MRLFIFLFMIAMGLYSCSNDLTSIGQNLINNSNNISQREIRLSNTGTIKLDSFATSSGENGYAITEMYMGRYSDDYSGITEAYPCFQIAPTYQPSIATEYSLDSITFHFSFSKKIWGDTLSPKTQTFELYQLKELPELPRDANNYSNYFYNISPIAWEQQPLASVSFLPKQSNIANAYFKIPLTPYMLDLFEKMKYKDEIFTPNANNQISYYQFLQYFKGLAIKAGDDNDCLMAIQATADSLYMRFHYHEAENNYYYDLKLLTQTTAYQYNRIITTPPDYFSILAESQKKEVLFSDTVEVAVVQGLSGYMVKMVIPNPEVLPAYTTVVKAEIEIIPRVWNNAEIAMPSTISVYGTTNLNEIKDIIYNTSTQAVTGKYIKDSNNSDNNRYIFDITDYYLRLQNSPSILGSEQQILLTIPTPTSSYDRLVIKETPVLRLYLANYR